MSAQKVILSGLVGGQQTAAGLRGVLRRRLRCCGGVPDEGLHRTLHRFAAEGLVEVRRWAAPPRGSPVWALTRPGRERVAQWAGSTANDPILASRLAAVLLVMSCLPSVVPPSRELMLRECRRLQAGLNGLGLGSHDSVVAGTAMLFRELPGVARRRRARNQAELRLVNEWLLSRDPA